MRLVRLWLLLLSFGAFGVLRAEIKLEAKLDRDTITLGESARLVLSFTDGDPNTPPVLPRIENLTIGFIGKSSSYSIINGRSISSVAYNYQVTAKQAAQYAIPAVTVVIGNERPTSAPLTLKVLRADDPSLGANSVTNYAFLKLIVPKREVFLGESFPVDIQLYVQEGRDLQMPQLKSDGFTVGKSAQPAQTRTQIGNQIYNVVTFRTSATAAKTGELDFGPAECSLVLHIPNNNPRRRGNSPFTEFDDFFGGRYEARPVTLSSETFKLRVLPLPKDGQPADFQGAVGNYAMRATTGPTNVAVGDPITVNVQITGRGNLDALSFSTPSAWREFNSYPGTSKIESTDPLGLDGTKIFEQVIAPENAEVKQLPPLTFSFFNPETRTYRTLTAPAVPLTVRPSAAAAQPTVLAGTVQPNAPTPNKDIVHIKSRLTPVMGSATPLLRQPWFLALQLIPVLGFVGAVVWRKRQEQIANNPRLRRSLQVRETIQRGLGELHQQAAAQDSDAFFANVFRLLQEQIGERLDLPASAITIAIVDEQLRPHGADAELVNLLHGLFQLCDQARFAPVSTSAELNSIVQDVEQALQGLQNLPAKE